MPYLKQYLTMLEFDTILDESGCPYLFAPASDASRPMSSSQWCAQSSKGSGDLVRSATPISAPAALAKTWWCR